MGMNRTKLRELPLVSIILVAVNVVVFFICAFTDKLYILGRESVPEVIINREYGRIIWSMFLHSDQYHIFNNMLILFFLGEMIEKEIGHIRYALFYFLSGIGGGLLSLWIKYRAGDWSASIGASGAVFGLDGVLLALVLFSGRRLAGVTPVRITLMILLSLYSGFRSSNIDNAAHIGGLLTGFVLGCILCAVRRIRENAAIYRR